MKKTLTVGDLHGKRVWEEAVKRIDDFDYIIIPGDYFDSFYIPRKEQLENFEDLLLAQKKCPDKLKLLYGNHDLGYYFWHTDLQDMTCCSGFSSSIAWKVQSLLYQNKECFMPSFQIGETLWTHSGMAQSIMDTCFTPLYEEFEEEMTVSQFINYLFKQRDTTLFMVGQIRGGRYPHGNIFWEDRRDLVKDPLQEYNQIVGHTHIDDITEVQNDFGHYTTFVDCLDSVTHFYEKDVEE